MTLAAPQRIATPDLVTNSYFPALAAEELGIYREEGIDAHLELMPSLATVNALRDGAVDFVAGGARGPDRAFLHLLHESGVDPARDGITIAPVPGADAPGASFGVLAADALERGLVDGFWANALGSETAVRRGVGRVVVDVRRGDGPPAAGQYTFAALATTDALIAREPERAAAAARAVLGAQRMLKADPAWATEVGRRRFPSDAAAIIAAVVERDLPFYDPVISRETVSRMNEFARAVGMLASPVAYEEVVATRFAGL